MMTIIDNRDPDEIIRELTAAVQALRAARATCPTCGGRQPVTRLVTINHAWPATFRPHHEKEMKP